MKIGFSLVAMCLLLSGCDGCGDEAGPGSSLGAVTEAEVATRFARSDGDVLVRMIGRRYAGGVVEDHPAGRGVEVAAVDPDALCHLIVEARIKPKVVGRYVGNVPDMPEHESAFGVASWPVLLPGSCDGSTGACYWSALFKGRDCLRVADSPYYVGSTMVEFIGLPVDRKARLLRIRGTCGGEDCIVPFGDARAVPGARAYVQHGWAGNVGGVDFVGAVDGAVVDDKYEVPK